MLATTSTQYAILNKDPESSVPSAIQSSSTSLRKRVGWAALKTLAILSGVAMMTIGIPMIKGYNGNEDPQKNITALGVILMITGEACIVFSLYFLFKRCFCSDS